MNLRVTARLSALGLLLISAGFSQSPATPPPPAPTSTAPPASQEPSPSDPSAIRVEVNEVIVPVTVTDDKGRFVSNLEKQDFQILDEGKPQSINFFSRERS